MYIHEQPEDRRRADLLIRQSFIITQSGVWIVVFLFVFVVTPLWTRDVWPLLDQPTAWSAQRAVPREHDHFVSVRADGAFFFDERRVTAGDLVAALRAARAGRRTWGTFIEFDDVYVRADRAAPFGAVRNVIRAAQAAGCPRVTFLFRRDPDAIVVWE
ncbi:MAG: biopolymer transporter ExbD [Acidobacteria bacterium]|nr:biopolymer transporter ExbD [Acidobacteriota bacterium]MBV9070678.1 biopolymer transporter ExbD [Acidobacteriota bacterium]MBV9478135.1 biopolymer transporter ExbD [Acidobacteriota bacterium]